MTKEDSFSKRILLTHSLAKGNDDIIESRRENESIEPLHEAKEALKRYFDEEKVLDFLKKKFGKFLHRLETEIDESEEDEIDGLIAGLFGKLIQDDSRLEFLKAYDLIPDEIADQDQLLKWSIVEGRKALQEFIRKDNLFDFSQYIDLINVASSNRTRQNLFTSLKHYSQTFYDGENYESRIKLFDRLFESKIIKGGQLRGHYECIECEPDTFSALTVTNMKPSNLKLSCPKCKNEMLYIIPYALDDAIFRDLISKDGLLGKAVPFLLDKREIQYETNVTQLDDIELDICLTNEKDEIVEIIELKMFKSNRPVDTQVTNIKKAVGQVKKAIDKLSNENEGFMEIRKSVIVNFPDQEVIANAQFLLKNDLSEYNIRIYNIEGFYSKLMEAIG